MRSPVRRSATGPQAQQDRGGQRNMAGFLATRRGPWRGVLWEMRDRHLVVSPRSPNVETVRAMLPYLEAAERDERCVWCGRTREDHAEEPGAAVPRMPCLGLRKYYKWF
jgi:hypothetical protein